MPAGSTRIAAAWARWLEGCLSMLFVSALVLNLVNALLRAVFDVGLVWADELQQYALVWLAFMGAALVMSRDGHLRMDLVRGQLPAGVRRALFALESVTLPLLCGFAAWQSALYLRQIFELDVRSEMGRLPMWLPHAAVTLGFALMTVLHLVRLARGKPRPETAP
jgi:TRAP-type C4-dicarboxylate transport system permease small subunit